MNQKTSGSRGTCAVSTNYNVGQKAALGWVLIVIFVGAGLVMALATVFSLLSGIDSGLTRMH